METEGRNMRGGKLSIVATPIGNLEDITLRALRTFKECDVIYAEDTRVISKLLARHEIKKPLQRLDASTEIKKADEIISRLEAGEKIVFVTDAGTPCISDPGARLVSLIRASAEGGSASGGNGNGIKIEVIPGPSAFTAALSIAGVDATEFAFLGFLPHKKGRQTAIKKIIASEIPVVLYESPHRILKLMKELAAAAPACRVTIGRELTKIHEEIIVGTPQEIAEQLETKRSAPARNFTNASSGEKIPPTPIIVNRLPYAERVLRMSSFESSKHVFPERPPRHSLGASSGKSMSEYFLFRFPMTTPLYPNLSIISRSFLKSLHSRLMGILT